MRGLWNRAEKRRKYITGGVCLLLACLAIVAVIPMVAYAVTICNACRGTGIILELSEPCTRYNSEKAMLGIGICSDGYYGPACKICGGTGKIYSPAEIRAAEEAKKRAVVEAERKRLEYEKFLNSRQTFTDPRDDKKYPVIKIGGKTWMAENLNYNTYQNYNNGKTAGYDWCYKDNESNCAKYGRLYDWNTAQSACPAGWHLPSRKEWGLLAVIAGGTGTFGDGGNAGTKLKSRSGWSGWNGTDDYGFSALPGGGRNTDGSFLNAGYGGYWWTATENGSGDAYGRYMYDDSDRVSEGNRGKDNGFSVRCVGD
jgi:uncharacterized protein (TIGR02145 family)